MAPALARRTPQKTFDKGRPKRQATLHRKETPGAPKKKEQAEKNKSEQSKKATPKKEAKTAKVTKTFFLLPVSTKSPIGIT